VCVITPGVLGSTGLESGEILLGAREKSGANRVLAIDALASRRLNRVCNTIQITDTGITPGSGVGNARAAIDECSMGVRVIALGVPTVVDAATLAADVIHDAGLSEPDAEALEPYAGGVIVTPRDIDARIRTISRLIGFGVDLALQDGMSVRDITDLLAN
jgi:spore protease